ncbi:MAG: hypothetical protein SPD80_04925 [Atopobium sp.]|uniref:hypothetical protein n=1 Tax=Atopobium sp. TaxID=1872650 RepID=UPI002A815122|nr:hypothetical protein [Atopobium sp.]MDY4522917.1 hypothetical protein [Atopobium sp.]
MDDIYNEKRVEVGITAMLDAAQTKGLNLLELKQAAESIAKVMFPAHAGIILTYDVSVIWTDSPTAMGGISDIINGATNGTCCEDKYGFPVHRKSYWKRSGEAKLSTETFAHFYETTMSNPEVLETLKRYLPKSYDVFKEILKEV